MLRLVLILLGCWSGYASGLEGDADNYSYGMELLAQTAEQLQPVYQHLRDMGAKVALCDETIVNAYNSKCRQWWQTLSAFGYQLPEPEPICSTFKLQTFSDVDSPMAAGLHLFHNREALRVLIATVPYAGLDSVWSQRLNDFKDMLVQWVLDLFSDNTLLPYVEASVRENWRCPAEIACASSYLSSALLNLLHKTRLFKKGEPFFNFVGKCKGEYAELSKHALASLGGVAPYLRRRPEVPLSKAVMHMCAEGRESVHSRPSDSVSDFTRSLHKLSKLYEDQKQHELLPVFLFRDCKLDDLWDDLAENFLALPLMSSFNDLADAVEILQKNGTSMQLLVRIICHYTSNFSSCLRLGQECKPYWEGSSTNVLRQMLKGQEYMEESCKNIALFAPSYLDCYAINCLDQTPSTTQHYMATIKGLTRLCWKECREYGVCPLGRASTSGLWQCLNAREYNCKMLNEFVSFIQTSGYSQAFKEAAVREMCQTMVLSYTRGAEVTIPFMANLDWNCVSELVGKVNTVVLNKGMYEYRFIMQFLPQSTNQDLACNGLSDDSFLKKMTTDAPTMLAVLGELLHLRCAETACGYWDYWSGKLQDYQLWDLLRLKDSVQMDSGKKRQVAKLIFESIASRQAACHPSVFVYLKHLIMTTPLDSALRQDEIRWLCVYSFRKEFNRDVRKFVCQGESRFTGDGRVDLDHVRRVWWDYAHRMSAPRTPFAQIVQLAYNGIGDGYSYLWESNSSYTV